MRAWLFTILHNQYVNYIRRAVREGAAVALNESVPTTLKQVAAQTVTEEPAETLVAAPRQSAPVPPPPPAIQTTKAALFSPLVQTLVSRQSSYAQKQAAWQQLRDAHQLDNAITELERATKSDPKPAEYPAALGIAYVQKLRTLQDFREQAKAFSGIAGFSGRNIVLVSANNEQPDRVPATLVSGNFFSLTQRKV